MLVGAGKGRATAKMTIRPEMVNGHGICHGGYLFLLADTAFAMACNWHGQPTVASGGDINFLAPAIEGDLLTATAVERATSGRTGLYDVAVTRGETVLAELRGRSRALDRRPQQGAVDPTPAPTT